MLGTIPEHLAQEFGRFFESRKRDNVLNGGDNAVTVSGGESCKVGPQPVADVGSTTPVAASVSQRQQECDALLFFLVEEVKEKYCFARNLMSGAHRNSNDTASSEIGRAHV